jgi:predicted transport protein
MPDAPKKFPYGVHASVKHMAAIASNLPAKTGKSLAEWSRLVETEGPATSKERMEWLKSEHGLGRDTAMSIVEITEGRGNPDPGALVDAMYAGPKAGLRPLYEGILTAALALGEDVVATPCSTYVPLLRKHTFAIIKPTTRTRIDLSLALPGVEPNDRLKLSKGTGISRITHVVGLSSLAELDDEVKGWLRKAYEG